MYPSDITEQHGPRQSKQCREWKKSRQEDKDSLYSTGSRRAKNYGRSGISWKWKRIFISSRHLVPKARSWRRNRWRSLQRTRTRLWKKHKPPEQLADKWNVQMSMPWLKLLLYTSGCLVTCLLKSLRPVDILKIMYSYLFFHSCVIEMVLRCFTKVHIEKSALDQVEAWCHQATSHYLSQCCQSS